MDSETFSLLRETVRRFVDERLIPNEDRVLRIYEGTSQIQQTIIAKALLREAGLKV